GGPTWRRTGRAGFLPPRAPRRRPGSRPPPGPAPAPPVRGPRARGPNHPTPGRNAVPAAVDPSLQIPRTGLCALGRRHFVNELLHQPLVVLCSERLADKLAGRQHDQVRHFFADGGDSHFTLPGDLGPRTGQMLLGFLLGLLQNALASLLRLAHRLFDG